MNTEEVKQNIGQPTGTAATSSMPGDLGAEPLEGSGFENETPEPDFEEEQQ